MFTAMNYNEGPFAIRFPRARGVFKTWKLPLENIEIGKGYMVKDGSELAILSIGAIGNNVIEACRKLSEDGIEIAHYNMRFVRPVDETMLHKVFKKFNHVITVEDGVVTGGFGSSVLEFMNLHGYKANILLLGIPDEFIEHGSINELQNICGFHTKNIEREVKKILAHESDHKVKNQILSFL